MTSQVISVASCSSSANPTASARDTLDVFGLRDNGDILHLRYQNGAWARTDVANPFAGQGTKMTLIPYWTEMRVGMGVLRAAALSPDHVSLIGSDLKGNALLFGLNSGTVEAEVLPWPTLDFDFAPLWSADKGNLTLHVFFNSGTSLVQYQRGVGAAWQGPQTVQGPSPLGYFSAVSTDPQQGFLQLVGFGNTRQLVALHYGGYGADFGSWRLQTSNGDLLSSYGANEQIVSCALGPVGYQYPLVFRLNPQGQIEFRWFQGTHDLGLGSVPLPQLGDQANAASKWNLLSCCARTNTRAELFLLNQFNQILQVTLDFPQTIAKVVAGTPGVPAVTATMIFSEDESAQPPAPVFDPLDSFSHVVVLMLENRSFDNLLGYLYPEPAPGGISFDGINAANAGPGGPLANPVPADAAHQPPPECNGVVTVAPVDPGNYFMPYPDPGETYPHVNTQLFNVIDGGDNPPYNLPNPPPGTQTPMKGFVTDYIATYKGEQVKGVDPTYDQYRQIMQCYTPDEIPVLSTLAKSFGVFDHWYCAVPSQTWCNRAFWNAGTSFGQVINGPDIAWFEGSSGTTLFNLIHESGTTSPLDWKVYSDQPYGALTGLIHLLALDAFHVPPYDKFPALTPNFFTDCAAGNLPAYSFLEPRFFAPHNDMHPSENDSAHYGKSAIGSVLLGEMLVQQVYDAIRTSNSPKPGANTSQNTLFIITFDEHGGCYDHVLPPAVEPPDAAGTPGQMGFDFKRLGVRVPMIMVSAHIAPATVVNTPMHHGSFLKTMCTKWNAMLPGKFPGLTERDKHAPPFTEVFTSSDPRPASDWPVIPAPAIPADYWTRDFSDVPLNDLAHSIVAAILASPPATAARKRGEPPPDPDTIRTVGQADAVLSAIPGLRPNHKPGGGGG